MIGLFIGFIIGWCLVPRPKWARLLEIDLFDSFRNLNKKIDDDSKNSKEK